MRFFKMSITQLFSLTSKRSLICIIGIMTLCGVSLQSLAQVYSLKINTSNFTLEGQIFNGYTTDFVQPYKEVKKEWWRYVNARTIIFNKKTHLVLTVPAKGKDTNEPLKFVSQLIEDKNKNLSTLKLALVKDEVPENQQAQLSNQVKNLLKDFKVNYFTALVQNKINEQEIAGKRISQRMDKYLLDNSKLQLRIEKKPEEKNELTARLKTNTAEIEKLQVKLNANQKKLGQYKKELTLIK
ncbi:hypothetical protein SAMN04488029_1627 [Reichenbachiella faecimaris]|uniref:Uncharacterized protein n=1 Tax=Reichenbachiella faecimaris TaxID=692418 RepID=A0A1W2GAL7_REIFA|nr:hypothetical protein [Reichenbachiella faecimaris]SMD33720.1 hypothetical protein SAMN04488029_1627 [Reichenbachiella faecimaris]